MMFEGTMTKTVLQYIKEKYEGNPEFLWAKTPSNAVFRHSGNLKWYAALLNVSKKKLGLSESENADILDLKCDPILVGALRDGKNYFAAYHMNKEHWITVLLNESVKTDELFALIDLSYKTTEK